MSREVPFEVTSTGPLRLVATLADGRKCEVIVRFPLIAVTDHEANVVVGGQQVPNIGVSLAPPIVSVRVLGEDEPPFPGISVSSGGKPN